MKLIHIISVILLMMSYNVFAKNNITQEQIENIKKINLELSNRITFLEEEVSKLLDKIDYISNDHKNWNINSNSTNNFLEKKNLDNLEQKYAEALGLFRNQKYNEAAEYFSMILEKSRNINFISNVNFYYGICKYKTDNFQESIEILSKFIENINTEKIPEALLIIADNQIAMNNRLEAIETLQSITKNYKHSEFAIKAKQKIRMLK
ncbi:hypothetical protein CDSE_0011 [Candidatus Kinetoplastibacterium desouzaii TCC079E]|uniref:Tetratricopeptide repeat protein n=1 Tax=Candidatus Kinetoplastidibacterium desouzai TCC079E TaxID=1208919 RepID=M1L308_9PROT|nr:tetratricopeptide repeat protein [Candidatus Kinetoplastibacterium desouzaii]AGF47138.1 hypothetical protein CDSE_0011 [Candidatus Kinetoplastibacterium desouzaii TCC079E]